MNIYICACVYTRGVCMRDHVCANVCVGIYVCDKQLKLNWQEQQFMYI